jgi:hypothetical protein
MIHDLVMALQKYSSSTNLTLFKFAVRFKFKFIENMLQTRLSSRLCVKESPDSTEQCTGEEPGFVPIVIGAETESATENDLNPSPSPLVEKGRMEG